MTLFSQYVDWVKLPVCVRKDGGWRRGGYRLFEAFPVTNMSSELSCVRVCLFKQSSRIVYAVHELLLLYYCSRRCKKTLDDFLKRQETSKTWKTKHLKTS